MRTFEISCGSFTEVIDLGDDHPLIQTFDRIITYQESMEQENEKLRTKLEQAEEMLLRDKGVFAQLEERAKSSEAELSETRQHYYKVISDRNSFAQQYRRALKVIEAAKKWRAASSEGGAWGNSTVSTPIEAANELSKILGDWEER